MKQVARIILQLLSLVLTGGGLILGIYGIWFTATSLSPDNMRGNPLAGIGTGLGIIYIIGGLAAVFLGIVIARLVRRSRHNVSDG